MTTAFTPGPPGPANPRPGGPTGPRPSGPSTPAPTRALAAIDALLAEAIGLAADRLPAPVDQLEDCGHAILLFRLQVARKAVSDLVALSKTPARRDPFSAAVGADAIATPGGPGRHASPGLYPAGASAAAAPVAAAVRAGCPPAPGPDTFSLPKPPEFAVGVARVR
jgi:hypothetical protein